MKQNLEYAIKVILAGGTAFSWTTVYFDFLRFQKIYGTVFRISGCTTPNPVITPCFYGAIAFAIGLYLAITNKFKELYWLLLGGTVFAWGNFSYEAYKFYFYVGPKVSCSGIVTDNIFTTPCFHGAVIYLLAFMAIKFYKSITY